LVWIKALRSENEEAKLIEIARKVGCVVDGLPTSSCSPFQAFAAIGTVQTLRPLRC
jgi:hypothetical protein